MAKSVLKEKSYAFSIRIIKLSNYLKEAHKAFDIARQILRSGTAIGALVREAEYASSKKDFAGKLTIALKEANECGYWLQLIYESKMIDNRMYKSLINDQIELVKILTSSVKTAKGR